MSAEKYQEIFLIKFHWLTKFHICRIACHYQKFLGSNLFTSCNFQPNTQPQPFKVSDQMQKLLIHKKEENGSSF